MGEDFAYSQANLWYESTDLLIDHINKHSSEYNMTIRYSTPSLYLTEINKQSITWPVNRHDFFPYADIKNAYWTGYFTSRTAFKGYIKDTGRYLQAIRNIFAIEKMTSFSSSFKESHTNYITSLTFFEQVPPPIISTTISNPKPFP